MNLECSRIRRAALSDANKLIAYWLSPHERAERKNEKHYSSGGKFNDSFEPERDDFPGALHAGARYGIRRITPREPARIGSWFGLYRDRWGGLSMKMKSAQTFGWGNG